MQDEVYRQTLKMRALERWENEGGRTTPQQAEKEGSDGESGPRRCPTSSCQNSEFPAA